MFPVIDITVFVSYYSLMFSLEAIFGRSLIMTEINLLCCKMKSVSKYLKKNLIDSKNAFLPRPHDHTVNSLVIGTDKTYVALETSQTWNDDASYTCDTHERC